MPAKYFTILTNIGSALHANAQIQQTRVPWTHMALGDGGGAEVQPDQKQSALVREVHRLPITAIEPHPTNPKWIVVEAVVPNNVGGWTVRETAIYGGPNGPQCIAVGNYPASYKPVLADGAVREMVMRMIVEISSTATVNLVIDPAVAIASRGWVETQIATDRKRGLVELADLVETDAGTDKERAITAEGLRSVLPRTAFMIDDGKTVNNLVLSGLYYVSGAINGPSHPTKFFGWIRHSAVTQGVYAYQEAFDITGSYWRRAQQDGVWSGWVPVQDKTQVDQQIDALNQAISDLVRDKEGAIGVGGANQYWGGDKTWKAAADIPVRAATEVKTGVAEIATDAEVLAGTDDQRIVTPKKLSSFVLKDPTAGRRGMPFCASDAELAAGMNQEKQVTPYLLRGVASIGQTLVDVTGSRAAGVIYTNTTQRPIWVTCRGLSYGASGRSTLLLTANGTEVGHTLETITDQGMAVSSLVLPGQTYSLSALNVTVNKWLEYR